MIELYYTRRLWGYKNRAISLGFVICMTWCPSIPWIRDIYDISSIHLLVHCCPIFYCNRDLLERRLLKNLITCISHLNHFAAIASESDNAFSICLKYGQLFWLFSSLLLSCWEEKELLLTIPKKEKIINKCKRYRDEERHGYTGQIEEGNKPHIFEPRTPTEICTVPGSD